MTPDLIAKLKEMTEEDEGRFSHMYLCSRGNVTCAVGHRIQNAHDAALLEFEPITEAVEDWHRVKLAPPGMRAAAYAQYCNSRMSDVAIDRLLESDVWQRIRQLRSRLPFDGYPEPAQLSVFNMAYQLGLEGMLGWPKFSAALAERDWLTCAAECYRRDANASRNAKTRARFLEASLEVVRN